MIPETRKPRSRRTAPAAATPAPATTPASATTGGNAGEWTVSELAGALKRTLEDAFGHVRLRGEIMGYRGPHSSGHAYFSLKDRDARIDAVVWKGTFARLAIKPEEGLEVIATGRVTTFPGKSAYQIVVEHLEPAGAGALMALLEERRRRLAAEGLFAEGRKRPLPFLPRVVGVVTSPTGAVIRDILHRLGDRFPRTVLVWPVRVQGETCAAEVAVAIAGFNALPPAIPTPDVLIVARGGGSLEDLWGFNDEAVVRAAVASAIPVIAAVGHETDWTLIDHAADRRAPTPTGAAEMAVPVRTELMGAVGALDARRLDAAGRLLEARRAELRSAVRALPGPDAILGAPRQKVDLMAARLAPALLANARTLERRLAALADGLARHDPRLELGRARTRLDAVGGRPVDALRRRLDTNRSDVAKVAERFAAARARQIDLERKAVLAAGERVARLSEQAGRAMRLLLGRRRDALAARADLLASLGYLSVLQRGYALVRDAEDRPVMRAGEVAPGASLVLEFADGRRRVQAEGGRTRRRGEALVQTSLFDM